MRPTDSINPAVLITGSRSPAALDLVRKFATEGWTVFTADCMPLTLAAASRYVHRHFRLPSPRFDFEAFRLELTDIVRKQHFDLLLPTCEEVFYIAACKDMLDAHTFVYTAPLTLLKKLHSKWEFNRLLQREGLPFPESRLLMDPDEKAIGSFGRQPFVLKPEFSRFGDQVLIFRDASDWSVHVKSPRLLGAWVQQAFIEGDAFCTYSLSMDGKLLAHASYPIIHRFGSGASIFFESVQIPEITTIVSRLCRSTGFTGQIAFDFIRSKDGVFYAIECNPRATSGIHLFSTKDRLPLIFQQKTAAPLLYPSGKPRMLSLLMLSNLAGQLTQPAAFRSLWADYARARDVVWSAYDWRPAIRQLLTTAFFAGRSWIHNTSLTASTTRDIEYNGE